MESLGIKAFRFSIEWSRVEPKNDEFDIDAIDHYVKKTQMLIDKGILPIISTMPKDNHSVLQLYLDGTKNNFFTNHYYFESYVF